MRKSLVVIVLILGFGLTAFSQSGGSLPTDSTKVKIGFPITLKLHWQSDSANYARLFNHPAITDTVNGFKLTEKKIFLGRPATYAIKAPHSDDKMPCMVPQGNFPMPVYRPDSAVNFTLLGK